MATNSPHKTNIHRPLFTEWSALEGSREVYPNLIGYNCSFTSCGTFFVVAKLCKSKTSEASLELRVYETETYQSVAELEPFRTEGVLKDFVPVVKMRCNMTSGFRVVAILYHGRFLVPSILAEYSSKSPYEPGTWRQNTEIKFQMPPGRTSVSLTLHPSGGNYLVWNSWTLYLCRDSSNHSLINIITDVQGSYILSADYALVERITIILRVESPGIRIFDESGSVLSFIQYNFCPYNLAILDPHGHEFLVLNHFKYPEFAKSESIKLFQIVCQSGRFQLSKGGSKIATRYDRKHVLHNHWRYEIWTPSESSSRRLIWTRRADIIYPHPVKAETIVTSSGWNYFALYEDTIITDPETLSNAPGDEIIAGFPISFWQRILDQEPHEKDRAWFYAENIRVSQCWRFIAFTACALERHGMWGLQIPSA